MKYDIIELIRVQLNSDIYNKKYIVYDFTTNRSWEYILNELGILYSTIINKNIYSNEAKLNFYNVLSYYSLNSTEHFLFLVNSMDCLKSNYFWSQCRKVKCDIYLDLYGNAGYLNNIMI